MSIEKQFTIIIGAEDAKIVTEALIASSHNKNIPEDRRESILILAYFFSDLEAAAINDLTA